VVMHAGHVEQIGAPLELYDRPANMFVAGFIGSPAMNFLKGKVANGGIAIGDLSLDVPHGSSARDGMDVIYGIRPEHWRLDDAGLPSTVRVVEPTGSETQVVADLAGHRIVCAFRERVQAHPGEILRISPDPSATHLFDEASGMRLA